MQSVSEEYTDESLQRILNGVTFFKELTNQNEAQFKLLMSNAQIIKVEPNQAVFNKDDESHSLFFLLRGQLSVYVAADDEERTLNEINAGEVFGIMSMFQSHPRSASIRTTDKAVLLAEVDFKHFKDIHDFSYFNLETKMSFYRMVSNSLRWTLERNKISNPNHSLIPRLYKIPLFVGQKGGVEELEALYNQSLLLAELVREWNES
jgi:CRP-like cAMP-binding protein